MKKINADDLIDSLDGIDPELYMKYQPAEPRKSRRGTVLRVLLIAAAALLIAGAAAGLIAALRKDRTPENPGVLPDETGAGQTSVPTDTTLLPTNAETTGTAETTETTETPDGGETVEYKGMIFRRRADARSYALVGTSEELESVEVPEEVNGLPVTEVGPVFSRDIEGKWTMNLSKNVSTVDPVNFRCPAGALTIVVDGENPNYKTENGCFIDRRTNSLLRAQEDFSLPETGLEEIGENAFYGHGTIESIVVPEGIEVIGASAFENCVQLRRIALPSTLKTVGANAFRCCAQLERASFVNVESYSAIVFDNALSDPASLCGCLYVNGLRVTPETNEPDRAGNEQTWAEWMYTDARAGFAHPMLASGVPMVFSYSDETTVDEETPGCAWEYWNGVFYFGYLFSMDSEPFAEDLNGYTWEIFYREKGSGSFRTITTAPKTVYRFPDANGIVFRLPTYEKGMKSLTSKYSSNDYDFLFVIHEGGDNGEIVGWYKDVITVTPTYEKYLTDAIRHKAFDAHEHSFRIIDAQAPTCVAYGQTRNVFCISCGETVEKAELILPLGHDYVDGVCTRCGWAQITHPGDGLYEYDLSGAQTLTGVQPDNVLHEGAILSCPIEFDKSNKVRISNNREYYALWLRIRFDKNEFDPHKLLERDEDYQQKYALSIYYTDDAGNVAPRYYYPVFGEANIRNCYITDIDQRYAVLHVAVYYLLYGRSGPVLPLVSGEGERYTASLYIRDLSSAQSEGETGSDKKIAVAYTARFSFALTDSFDRYLADYCYKESGIRFDRVHEHVYKTVVSVQPTCVEDGRERTVCEICGYLLETSALPALGHDYADGRCTRCGCCQEHTFVTLPAVAPTCTATGLTEGRYCSVCGFADATQSTIPALGHDCVDGVCTRCGATADTDDTLFVLSLSEGGNAEKLLLRISYMQRVHPLGKDLSPFYYVDGKYFGMLISCYDELPVLEDLIADTGRYTFRLFWRESGAYAFESGGQTAIYSISLAHGGEVQMSFETRKAGMTDVKEGKYYDMVFTLWDGGELVCWFDEYSVAVSDSYFLYLPEPLAPAAAA